MTRRVVASDPADLLADVFEDTEDAPMPRWATVITPGMSSVQLVPDDDGSAEAARWPSSADLTDWTAAPAEEATA